MKSSEIRSRFLEFFKNRGHAILPSASLVPENDPSVLFTTAGMQPLVPFLLGAPHPQGKRLVNVQKCVRTQDIDEVGDNTHDTFFEMLGNWSLGDYFKKETIQWSYEFLTDSKEGLGLSPSRLYITVFEGDTNAPRDVESAAIWESLGIPKSRIYYLPKEKNWWSPGDNGPCGPDTEMFYDVTEKGLGDLSREEFLAADSRQDVVELWNDVFMEYEKSVKTLLIDAIECLVDKEGNINNEIFNAVEVYKGQVVVVTNADEEKRKTTLKNIPFEIFSLNGNPDKTDPAFFKKLLEQYNLTADRVIYFDHKKENVESAQQTGILSLHSVDTQKIQEFIEKRKYHYIPLKQKNVDTGAGLERLAMVMQEKRNVFETDLFVPIINIIKSEAKNYNDRSARIIADHIRTSVFLINDGIIPSNTDRGYVLRKLLRRAIRHVDFIGMDSGQIGLLVQAITDLYLNIYVKNPDQAEYPYQIILEEEERFRKTLKSGLREFQKIVDSGQIVVSGAQATVLATTYGFPLDLTTELAEEKGIKVDRVAYEEEIEKHRQISHAGAEKKFKGGLADTSEISTKYHTATHLLHQALREVLGTHVFQKGSNITPERLRFDFSHSVKMTDEEKKKVEDLVNWKIAEKLPVSYQDIPLEEAQKRGAIGLFEDKYGDTVRIYQIGEGGGRFSLEFCGGPHVSNTSELGKFKIVKEEAVAAGIRRIKAILS